MFFIEGVAFLTGFLIFPALECLGRWIISLFPYNNCAKMTCEEYKKCISFPNEGRSLDDVVAHLKDNGLSNLEFVLSCWDER